VWWLDADDRLDADNRERARELFARLGDERDAYAMKVRSRLNSSGSAFRMLDQVRLFPNHPAIRWRYRIHEQIMPAVRARGGDLRCGKHTESLAACAEGLVHCPDDAELLFERAVLLHEGGDHSGAEESLRRLLTVRPGQYLASVDGGLRGYRSRHLLGEVCRS